jgi:ferredoxin
MRIKKVWAVFFSPTGTSKTIVEAIASKVAADEHETIDLTHSETTEKCFEEDELVVMGVPVYAGRVAPLAKKRLNALQGGNTPAVVVVLYGNREYEDALLELKDLAMAASFTPIAGAAFVGMHSFSNNKVPIAPGRPDDDDLLRARVLAGEIIKKLGNLRERAAQPDLIVPGNSPYKESPGPMPVTPEVDADKCTGCGICVPTCPDAAISLEEGSPVRDVERCIFCCACIRACPEQALFIDAPAVQEKRKWLHDNYARRKEPELFL